MNDYIDSTRVWFYSARTELALYSALQVVLCAFIAKSMILQAVGALSHRVSFSIRVRRTCLCVDDSMESILGGHQHFTVLYK
jgi:hypothetical protein